MKVGRELLGYHSPKGLPCAAAVFSRHRLATLVKFLCFSAGPNGLVRIRTKMRLHMNHLYSSASKALLKCVGPTRNLFTSDAQRQGRTVQRSHLPQDHP